MGSFTSHLIAFILGGLFVSLALILGAVLVLRSLPERVRGLKGGSKGRLKRRAIVSPPPFLHPVNNVRSLKKGEVADPGVRRVNGDEALERSSYDPQLTKVGWMRIATRPLTTDELYMDGFGNPGEWFLDGLAVRPTTQDSLPGESLSSLPNAVKRKQNIVSNIASMSGTAVSIVEASLQTTSYLLSRFMGESPPLPAIAVASKAVENTYNSRPPWRNVFAVLKHKTLFVYSSDERLECLDIILLTEFKVDLFPENLRDSELYLRETPIRLRLKGSSSKNGETVSGLYLYTASGSDKEDWLFMLRRASHLPPHADVGALSVHFQDTEPMRHFTDAMVKLKTTVEGLEGAQGHATAWLNALVGRAFVGLHASPKIKDWVIRKLSRKYTRARGTSILGDIVIQDLFVGDSIPILSNPKLLGFSTDGDVNVEVDIDYTGGVMVEAATLATISVSAFEPYVKPLQIPLVVSIKVKRFSARVLIKIKPNVETSRVWVGFYREPGLKLELDVEPIIWNKLIRLQVVNQIIERRIKEALEELVVLPNMDDFGFWPSDGKGGFWESDEEDEEETTNEEEDYEDAEDGYGEDENIVGQEMMMMMASPPRVLEDRPQSKTSHRASTLLEAVEEDQETDSDPEMFYRKLQDKYMEEALKAQQAEALWFAENAGISDDEIHQEEPFVEDQPQSEPGETDEAKSVASSYPRDSAAAPPVGEEDQSSTFDGSEDRDSLTATRQRLSITTHPEPTDPSTTDSQTTTPTSVPDAHLRPPSSLDKPKTPTMAVFEYLGETAEYAGRKSREYGLDEMARSVAETATVYGSTLKMRTAVLSDRTLAYFGYTRTGRGLLEAPVEEVEEGNRMESGNAIPEDIPLPPPRSRTAYRSRPPSIIEDSTDTPPLSHRTSNQNLRSRPQTPDNSTQTSPNKSTKPRPPSILEMLGVNITTAAPEQKPPRRPQKRRSMILPSTTPILDDDPPRDPRLRPPPRRPKQNLTRRSMDDLRPSTSDLHLSRRSLTSHYASNPSLGSSRATVGSVEKEEGVSDEEGRMWTPRTRLASISVEELDGGRRGMDVGSFEEVGEDAGESSGRLRRRWFSGSRLVRAAQRREREEEDKEQYYDGNGNG